MLNRKMKGVSCASIQLLSKESTDYIYFNFTELPKRHFALHFSAVIQSTYFPIWRWETESGLPAEAGLRRREEMHAEPIRDTLNKIRISI